MTSASEGPATDDLDGADILPPTMDVAVTGASGHIGSNLVRQLLERGDRVRTLAAAERGRTGASYLVGGHYRPLEELAEVAAEVTGVPAPRLVSPMWLARFGAPFATLWGRLRGTEPLFTAESLRAVRLSTRIDDSRARRELGHAPRLLADTVRDVYDWFERAGVL